MPCPDSPGYSFAELAGMLRAAAACLYSAEAAIRLLIGHQTWLLRDDFTDRFITVEHNENDPDDDAFAFLDWPAAINALDEGRLPCSGSEAGVLRIAASLADNTPVNLGQALGGLDSRNLILVLAAIAHTNRGGFPFPPVVTLR